MTDIFLTKRIMRRIYALYILRLLFRPFMMGASLLAFGAAGLFLSVSLSAVIANMPPLYEPLHFYQFFYAALLESEWVVKLFVTLCTLPLIWFSVQSIRRMEILSLLQLVRFRLPMWS